MARGCGGWRVGAVCLVVLLLIMWSLEGFYLPRRYLQFYSDGAELVVKVKPITSMKSTELMYAVYSLPFCRPRFSIKEVTGHIGELPPGEEIVDSPYKFQMKDNKKDVKLCVTEPLTEKDVKNFKQWIDDSYQMNSTLDGLPVTRYTRPKDTMNLLRLTGSPIGFKLEGSDEYYIYNHLRFKVLIHPYEGESSMVAKLGTRVGLNVMPSSKDKNLTGANMVVGFEVVPCSVVRDPLEAAKVDDDDYLPAGTLCDPDGDHQAIKEGESIVFSYDVGFVISWMRWPQR